MAQISGLTTAGQITTADLLMINQGNNGGIEKKVDIDTLDSYFKCKKSVSFSCYSGASVSPKAVIFGDVQNDNDNLPALLNAVKSPVFIYVTASCDVGGTVTNIYYSDCLNFSSYPKNGTTKGLNLINTNNFEYGTEKSLIYYGYLQRNGHNYTIPGFVLNEDLINTAHTDVTVIAWSMNEFTIDVSFVDSGSAQGTPIFTKDNSSYSFVKRPEVPASTSRNYIIIDDTKTTLPSDANSNTLYFIP